MPLPKMWSAKVFYFVISIASISAQLINGTVPQNGTNVTHITHITHVQHVVVHHHQTTLHNPNVTMPMPFDAVSSLPPLATTSTAQQPPPSAMPAGIPHYKHPHFDEQGKPLWFPRIVGGTPATIGEFPSKVSLQMTQNSAHFCGGTLLTMKHVLTAAHCITNSQGVPMSVSRIQAMADDLYILPKTGSPTRQVRQVKTITIHDKYQPSTLENDIAIVKLASEFAKTSTLYSSKRASNAPAPGQLCALAGWGVTSEFTQQVAPTLQRVNLEVVSFESCNLAYQGTLTKGMLCASAPGRDACQGDSGGALICQNKVAGVVSFGAGCAHPKFPGVYMDVVHFEKWISKAMNGAERMMSSSVWSGLVGLVVAWKVMVYA